jgi:hypothetical protein
METISIREFSRRVTVSDTAIRKAISAGWIVGGKVMENGVPRINFEIAKKEWELYQSQQGKTTTIKQPQKINASKAATPIKSPDNKSNPTPATHGAEEIAPRPPAGSLAAARLVQAQIKAKQMDVALKKEMGELVDKSKVYAALFSIGKEIRQTLQAIPDRHIDDILAAGLNGSRNEAHVVLTNAIADALETLAELSKVDLNKAAE